MKIFKKIEKNNKNKIKDFSIMNVLKMPKREEKRPKSNVYRIKKRLCRF